MKKYKCLKDNIYANDNGYTICPIRKCDIMLIKEWRNSQIDILRQNKLLTNKDQKKYFDKIIFPSFNYKYPEQILFSFLKNDKCIGYGGIVHIDWIDKRGEISFLVDTIRKNNHIIYKQDFINFLILIKIVTFRDLKFNRIYTEAFNNRSYHLCILEAAGFVYEGCLKQHKFINGKYIDSLMHRFLKEEYHEK